MAIVYLLIGGNQGDRLTSLKEAKAQLALRVGEIDRESAIYETEPWGFNSDQHFLNQLLIIKTNLAAEEVLATGLEIERNLGRIRDSKEVNTPIFTGRTMDIDILFYDRLVMDENQLTIPHPRLHLRRFALVPLNEIAENRVHPSLNKSMKQLLAECADEQKVTLFSN